jgi:hypothetical protein
MKIYLDLRVEEPIKAPSDNLQIKFTPKKLEISVLKLKKDSHQKHVSFQKMSWIELKVSFSKKMIWMEKI